MPNLLKLKRGAAASIPTGQLAEPLFTSDTYDLYIGTGASNQRFQKYIASGTSSQFLKGDGSLDSTSYQTALTFSSPLVNTSGTISIPAATGSVDGYLTSTDFTTFNAKEPAITAGTTLQYYRGDKTFQTLDTAAVPENGAIYFTEPRVRATVLTGLNLSGGGTIAATDSVLTAFGKLQNQISAVGTGVTYQGTWNASTNTPTLASGTGTKGYYYVVSVAGSTNIDGITDWNVGDWIIFNGTVWDQVDNTDAVSSVNGFTGAVNLALDNISDVDAASPTNAQLLRFNGTSSLWENWTPTFEPALTKGNLTEATSSVLTITGGTGAVIGSGTSIEVKQASGSTSGYLSSTDWTTFNNKQNALTNPVTGTGTTNQIAYWDSASSIAALSTATYPSLTELSYVKGVTSAIQTQIDGKLSLTGGTLTGALSGTSATFSDFVTLSKSQNTDTVFTTTNANTGASATAQYFASNGTTQTQFFHTGTAYNTVGVLEANQGGIYNTTSAGIAIIAGGASGQIRFATGTSFTTRLTISSTGAATFSSSVTATAGIFNLNTTNGGFKVTAVAATPPNLAYLANNYFAKFYTRPDQNYGITIFDQSEATAIQSADLVNGSNARALILNPYGGNVGIGTSSINAKLEVAGAVMVSGADAVAVANRGALDFSSGNTRLLSFGANTSTQGGFQFLTLASNGTGSAAMIITSGGRVEMYNSVLANSPSEGATGEGLIAGRSFKIDGTGTSQTAKMYMVSKDLSDTYGSGLTLQGANFAGDKAFGFNLNTSGGFETYIKNSGGSFIKAVTINNAGESTFSNKIFGTNAAFSNSSNGESAVSMRNTSTGTAAVSGFQCGNDVTTNGGGIGLFGSGFTSSAQYRANGAYVYSNQSGGLTLHAEGANAMYLATNGTERVRIMSDGWLLIKNVASTPASNPTAGGYLFVDSGRLYFRGSSGTITLIANA